MNRRSSPCLIGDGKKSSLKSLRPLGKRAPPQEVGEDPHAGGVFPAALCCAGCTVPNMVHVELVLVALRSLERKKMGLQLSAL